MGATRQPTGAGGSQKLGGEVRAVPEARVTRGQASSDV